MTSATPTATAVLGGGCFWCLDAVFRDLDGVLDVQSGYAGGRDANPSYEDVCSGSTGHAEVVRVTFDPDVLAFRDLLRVFFTIHDPTTLDRQGNDVGTQYRSVIFCETPEQRADAEAVIAELTARKAVAGPRRDRARRQGDVLSGGDVSPGLFHAQRRPTVLRVHRRAEGREIPQGVRDPPEAQGERVTHDDPPRAREP